jgi:signal transduction histidine kinase
MKLPLALAALLFFWQAAMCQTAFSQDDYAGKQLSVAQCLDLSQQNRLAGDLKEATRYLNTAAMHVWEAKNYKDAIKYFGESIELNKQLNNLSGIAKLHSNLGMIYADLREYEQSLQYFQHSLDYRLKHGEKTEIISTYINKAVVLNSLHRYEEAARNLEESLRLATEMSDASQMKSCYGMLAETYEKAGNQERTIHYFNLYRTFHEMVQRNKVFEANKETEVTKLRLLETELEKKEKELQLLMTSNELKETELELENLSSEKRALVEGKSRQDLALSLLERQLEVDELKIRETEARNSQQKILIAVSVAALILLSLLMLLLYRTNIYRRRTNSKLSEQNEEIRTLNENLESQVQSRTFELRNTLTSLEKRNRDLDQFSHVISHNLRGPVANILGLGRVVNRKNLSDPFNMEVFDRLQGATQNLDSVVKDLSMILQVTDNQGIPKERVNVPDMIKCAEDMLRAEIDRSCVEIVVHDRAKQLDTVKAYFESILYNLISNAIHYAMPSRVPKVKITTSMEGDMFKLQVEDNGTGINAADVKKIFEPYKRLTIEGEGKGLGLYLVRTQLDVLGGSIEVASEEGKGSTFTILLPQ